MQTRQTEKVLKSQNALISYVLFLFGTLCGLCGFSAHVQAQTPHQAPATQQAPEDEEAGRPLPLAIDFSLGLGSADLKEATFAAPFGVGAQYLISEVASARLLGGYMFRSAKTPSVKSYGGFWLSAGAPILIHREITLEPEYVHLFARQYVGDTSQSRGINGVGLSVGYAQKYPTTLGALRLGARTFFEPETQLQIFLDFVFGLKI